MSLHGKAFYSMALLASCGRAFSADAPLGPRKPFPLPLRSDDVAATFASPGGEYLVVVLRGEHRKRRPTPFSFAPPIGVWQVSIKEGRPVFADAVRVGRMPRVGTCKDGLKTCLRDNVLYGVYATSSESGTRLAFCAVPMTGSWAPEDEVFSHTVVTTVNGTKGRFDVMKYNVPPPKHIRFGHAPEFGGRRVVAPKPIAIFFDSEDELCVLGNCEEEGGLFLVRSEDRGKTWENAVPISWDVLPAQRPAKGVSGGTGVGE